MTIECTEKITLALTIAKWVHRNQKRKYTNEPYIVHPIAVAERVSEYKHTEDMICAAFLHDTIEDTDVTYETLLNIFGIKIADLVFELTDNSKLCDGNREHRKEIDREFLSHVSSEAQTIKLADLIDNTKSICEYDKKFAKVYLEEKRQLLKVLGRGDTELYAFTLAQLKDERKKLGI